MKRLQHIAAVLVSYLTGVPALTPRQRAHWAELEREHTGQSSAPRSEQDPFAQ